MAQAHPDEPPDNETSTKTASEEITHSGKPHLNGSTGNDPDAQAMVIASLKAQIQDLFTQVTQLNGKLVNSYDRVSDLEDDLHVMSSNLRSSSLKISQLELERTQHLAALNTGLLVEKAQVTAELTRLMEKATEEAAQRGQAESARAAIEKDLDDLSATLFDQANTMVAEARFARSLSEDKVRTAEQALKGAEEAVTMMQQQMQRLQTEKEEAERTMQDMQVRMGKGKWVERLDSGQLTPTTRLLSSHLPYQEFLLFVAHLRSLHSSTPQIPAISTLLPLPFLTRLLTEDSEPTIRLDLAPSLNWLSRRSVLAAIHNGQLQIEPIASAVLLQESSNPAPSIAGLSIGNSSISCALCGIPVFPNIESQVSNGRPPLHPTLSQTNGNSWSTFIKRPLNYSSPPPSPPPRSKSRPSIPELRVPPQVYIFRVTGPTTNSLPSVSIPSLPITASPFGSTSNSTPSQTPSHPHGHHPSPSSTQSSNVYPLCTSGWCLTRLRATCSLWAFVRSGIVEKVWEEEIPNLFPPPAASSAPAGDKPPVPPRRRGLWGMASALGERAASWSESDKDKKKIQPQPMSKQQSTPVSTPVAEKKLPVAPTPPPVHPRIAAASTAAAHVAAETAHHSPVKPSNPPPLPKRNEGRRPTRPDTNGATTPTQADNAPAEGSSPIAESPLAAQPPEVGRPHSPARVPLPESRPATPVNTSRTASPAPGVTGTPPPLPRRAVARGPRPMSAVGAAETAANAPTEDVKEAPPRPVRGAKRMSTSAEAEPTPAPVESNEKPDPEVAGEGDAPAEDSGEKGTDLPATSEVPSASDEGEASVSTELSTENEPSEPVPEAADVTTAEASPSEKTAESEPPQPASPTAVVTEDGEQVVEAPAKTEGENDVEKSAEGQTDSAVLGPVVSLNEEEPVINGKTESIQKATEDEKEAQVSKEDQEVYVGDATWEERTWKEVVRLKEVMFWARVGGLRSEVVD